MSAIVETILSPQEHKLSDFKRSTFRSTSMFHGLSDSHIIVCVQKCLSCCCAKGNSTFEDRLTLHKCRINHGIIV